MTVEEAFQTALAHHQAGRLAEAGTLYRQILAVQPRHADALHLLGVAAAGGGRYDEALALISQALALAPAQPVYRSNLGVTLRRMGRLEEAAVHLRHALALDPNFADAHMSLGGVLDELGRYDEAIACSRRALELRPDFAEAWSNLGNSLSQTRRLDEAIECHRRAVALAPGNADFHGNLGSALVESARWDEATASLDRALELMPDFAEALSNLALASAARGRNEEALAFYRRALAIQPGLAGAHWNFSHLLLMLGQFEEGWREYEWRWRYVGFPSPRRNFRAPQWDGSPVPGATILLHVEQGYGDAIQFMRYVPLVRERAQAARVLVECPAPLARIFTQGGGWDAQIVVRHDWEGTGLPPFDFHLPLLSLPLALKIFEPLPMAAPYLRADETLRAQWRERLRPGFRAGLAWSGSNIHRNDARRSIAPEKLGPLLRVEGVEFISLQVERRGELEGISDLTAHITDFADTAALIAELDLVITVDTAVAHLAGALGKPVWTLLTFVPDWRWGIGSESTPWYPTMRIFRQPVAGDWDSAIARIVQELERLRA